MCFVLQTVKQDKGQESLREDQWENAKKKVRAKIQTTSTETTTSAGTVASAEDVTDEEEELIKEIVRLISKKVGPQKKLC